MNESVKMNPSPLLLTFSCFTDLSNCKLIQVPDALYFMIEERNIEISACNLSSNVIKRIPPKFPNKFNLITDLNLAHNKLSTLPEEISKCNQLETVDISHNLFISLPNCLLELPKIIQINAAKNSITGKIISMYYLVLKSSLPQHQRAFKTLGN